MIKLEDYIRDYPSMHTMPILDYTSRIGSNFDNPPVYIAPEPTGDELVDEMLELQAYREHKRLSDEWDTEKQKRRALMESLLTTFRKQRQANKIKP